MASLSEYFNKGEQAAANAKGAYAESIMKGVQLPAAPAPKAYAAALPPSKGAFAAPPSKGIILSLLVYLSFHISLTCFSDDCCFNESEDILPALMATDAMRCNRRVNFLAGYSAANSMQLEAAMCPMTMYELGKSQKLYAETNAQLQRANSLNSVLMSEKRTLQNENAVSCLYSACYFFIIFLFNILTV